MEEAVEAFKIAVAEIDKTLELGELSQAEYWARYSDLMSEHLEEASEAWEEANHRLLSNIADRDDLKARLKEARLWVRTVDRALDVLGENERLILERFYIRRAKGNIDRLCGELKSRRYTIGATTLCGILHSHYTERIRTRFLLEFFRKKVGKNSEFFRTIFPFRCDIMLSCERCAREKSAVSGASLSFSFQVFSGRPPESAIGRTHSSSCRVRRPCETGFL